MKLILLIEITVAVLLLVFWCTQFLKLMRMRAEEFPSESDKIIWAATLIVLNALGAFVFWLEFKPNPDGSTQLEDNKYRDIRDLDEKLYEEAKNKFPNEVEEINLALNLSAHDRLSLEHYYRKRRPSVLLQQHAKGPKDIRQGCFGILLAVLTARNMDSLIPNQELEHTEKTPAE